MIQADESALICDFAEVYHIMDYRALPLKTAAALACGLRENSRIRMKLSGQKVETNTILLAGILDRLTTLAWMQTKDGRKGRNQPVSVLARLTGKETQKDETEEYQTGEEFDQAWKAITKGG